MDKRITLILSRLNLGCKRTTDDDKHPGSDHPGSDHSGSDHPQCQHRKVSLAVTTLAVTTLAVTTLSASIERSAWCKCSIKQEMLLNLRNVLKMQHAAVGVSLKKIFQ